MADRVKYSYRGKTYTRKSKRPGKKAVRVAGYCRRKARKLRDAYSRNDMPF